MPVPNVVFTSRGKANTPESMLQIVLVRLMSCMLFVSYIHVYTHTDTSLTKDEMRVFRWRGQQSVRLQARLRGAQYVYSVHMRMFCSANVKK